MGVSVLSQNFLRHKNIFLQYISNTEIIRDKILNVLREMFVVLSKLYALVWSLLSTSIKTENTAVKKTETSKRRLTRTKDFRIHKHFTVGHPTLYRSSMWPRRHSGCVPVSTFPSSWSWTHAFCKTHPTYSTDIDAFIQHIWVATSKLILVCQSHWTWASYMQKFRCSRSTTAQKQWTLCARAVQQFFLCTAVISLKFPKFWRSPGTAAFALTGKLQETSKL